MNNLIFTSFLFVLLLTSCAKDSTILNVDDTETTERVLCLSSFDCSNANGLNIGGKPLCFWRLEDIVAEIREKCPEAIVTFKPAPFSGFVILEPGQTQSLYMTVTNCRDYGRFCSDNRMDFSCDLDDGECTEECGDCDDVSVFGIIGPDPLSDCCHLGLTVQTPPGFDCEYSIVNHKINLETIPPDIDFTILGPNTWSFCGKSDGIVSFETTLLDSNGEIVCELPSTFDLSKCN